MRARYKVKMLPHPYTFGSKQPSISAFKLDISHFEIKDTTSQHTNHANYKGGSHLRMKII